jgi:cytochrome c-type biogenesis protein CcmH/NrfG
VWHRVCCSFGDYSIRTGRDHSKDLESMRADSRLIIAGIVGFTFALMPTLASAGDVANLLSQQALQHCEQGRATTVRETRRAYFEQGQALAEQAVAANEGSADAHFALFCNLGEQLRLDGESLTSLLGFRRMMNELDRALEIDPTHIDALSAKGTLLVKLPGLLGGDSEKGEELLQHVIKRAPKAVNARLALAKVRCERGSHQEAVALASDALAIASKDGRTTFVHEAKTVLRQAQTHAAKTVYAVNR